MGDVVVDGHHGVVGDQHHRAAVAFPQEHPGQAHRLPTISNPPDLPPGGPDQGGKSEAAAP